MKALRILALAVVFCSACVVHRTVYVNSQGQEIGQETSYQTFYDELSPYGQWVNYSNYGYVWIPNCGPGFTPYSTGGHWAYTDYGWTWASNYSWGWAPYHYGSWGYDAYYGWYWVPGNTWGPAWVSWRHCDGYYGWAPLGPDYQYGVTRYDSYNIPAERWCFVDHRHMGDNDMERYYGPRDQYSTYIRQSTVIGNTSNSYYTGPSRTEVEGYAGHSIAPMKVEQSARPGQSVNGNNINIYRPRMAQSTSTQPKPAPTKPVDIKQVTPVTQRPVYEEKTQPRNEQKVEPQQRQQQKVEPQQRQEQKVEPQREPERQQQQQRVEPQQRQEQRVEPQQRQEPQQQQRTQPQQQQKQQQKQQKQQSQPKQSNSRKATTIGNPEPNKK